MIAQAAIGAALLASAFSDTDHWWAAQGSPPPPVILQAGPVPGGLVGYGERGTGRIWIDARYTRRITSIVVRRGPRRGKVLALVGMWTLAAHEQGHTIGYDHTASGVMCTCLQPPGRAFDWAGSMLDKLNLRQ